MSEIFQTKAGTYYLQECQIELLSKPSFNYEGMDTFLRGFDSELHFESFLDELVDEYGMREKPIMTGAEKLVKTAGQLCYLSFGPKRTLDRDAQRYFDNVKDQKHGSILENANFSFLFYGISRSCTHELVRHRAGFAYSQVSQRYVDGSKLRFVERPEYQNDTLLHDIFEERIDYIAMAYGKLTKYIEDKQKEGAEVLNAESKTDRKKKIQQCTRSILPNETEAPIIVTANARAWRHFIEMRASEHAEIEIRLLALKVCRTLKERFPLLFGDYEFVDLPDGTQCVDTKYRKV